MSRRNLGGGAREEDDEELSTSEDDDDFQKELVETIKQAFKTSTEDDKELHTSENDNVVQEDIEVVKKSGLRTSTGCDSDLYSSDNDDDCQEDLEVLKQACLRTGTNPNDIEFKAAAGGGESLSDSESDDDLELFRSIKSRLGLSDDVCESMEHRGTPPTIASDDDDDAEDDFQTLRTIQSRFSACNTAESESNRKDDCLRRTNEVNESSMPFQEASSSHLENGADAIGNGRFQHFEEFHNTSDLPSGNMEIPSSRVSQSHPSDASNISENLAFPKSAQMLMDAIKRNRSYQKFVRNHLTQIEAKMEENKKLRERVKIFRDLEISCKKRTGRALSLVKDPRVQLISTRKSHASKDLKDNDKASSKRYGPPENSQVANFRMALTKFPLSLHRKSWTKGERENLMKGIRRQFEDMVLRGSAECGSEESCRDRSNSDSIPGSIEDLEITPEMIRKFLPKVDWNQLALTHAPGRSGAECEARWLNHEDPLINHGKWTAEEEKKLLSIIQEKGNANWHDIAALMGAQRTPFQCLAHYQRSLNACILNREWTEEEDDKLRSAVETFGEHNWHSVVASTLTGRTGTQCSNRWKKTLNPARQRVGRWSADEDKRLEVAVMLFGPKNWKKIAGFIPGRTQVQCRERWVNSLDPSINRDEWTEEEDSRLEAAIKEHGYCWSKVAACVSARTDNQCWRRWKNLHKDQVPLLQEARQIRKAACISNFVDRESERPALSPDDLIQLMRTGSKPEPEKVNAPSKRKRKRRESTRSEEENTARAPSVRPVKNRPKRCRKRVKISSEEVHEVISPDETEAVGGKDGSCEERRTQSQENNNCDKSLLDESSSPPSVSAREAAEPVNNKSIERKVGIKRTPKRHPWRRKFSNSDREQESLEVENTGAVDQDDTSGKKGESESRSECMTASLLNSGTISGEDADETLLSSRNASEEERRVPLQECGSRGNNEASGDEDEMQHTIFRRNKSNKARHKITENVGDVTHDSLRRSPRLKKLSTSVKSC